MTGILFFTPYIGDTILATALADRFSEHFNTTVYVANKDMEMFDLTDQMGGHGYYDSRLESLLLEGSKLSAPLAKEFMGGTDFSYEFLVSKDKEKWFENLCELAVVSLFTDKFDTIFTLHYSYPFAKLGQIAKKHGHMVYGYCLNEQNKLYFSMGNTDSEISSLWSKDFIGDRLSNIVTGSPLTRENYAITLPRDGIRHGVGIFPTTRGQQVNAENWFTDYAVLGLLGKPNITFWHTSEPQPPYPFRFGTKFGTVEEMITYIKSAEFIICYDSASFHLAWLTDTPAIVKLKGGFNEEWIPSWVKDNPNYYFIPSNVMYEEEYVGYLNEGLRQLGVIR